MRVHFIAIGGSAMHNLAIALKLKGFEVTGSDDEIFDPARSRLEKYGILPDSEGWKPSRIDAGIDAVILGMHARADNPELLRSRELELKIYSYPEYLYEQSKDKTRVVIAGSHGKTTITSMILHVLNHAGVETDYMVGAQLEGFEVMVRFSDISRYMILEGDEYLSSALDRRPKFHLYKPDIALISGIAWDHMNVFPTFENYVDQFVQFIELIEENGRLIYCEDDPELQRLVQQSRQNIKKVSYGNLGYVVNDKVTSLIWKGKKVPLKIFGRHNIQNLHGAWLVCRELGVSDMQFLAAIGSFTGASKRLQMLWSGPSASIFKDFAHSPSKLRATIHAVKEQYPGRELVACLELHTFSSLNKDFLPQYRGCMDLADQAIVYYSEHALALKRLPDLTHEEVREAFSDPRLKIFNDPEELQQYLQQMDLHQRNLLLMSSGNFDGLNPQTLHPAP
jgi:UDP-N-acetylmuramate: L-alanyl-gamma-D-glutamyl-meso-diaminopimelate ligase